MGTRNNMLAKDTVPNRGMGILPSEKGNTININMPNPLTVEEYTHNIFELKVCSAVEKRAGKILAKIRSRKPTLGGVLSLISCATHSGSYSLIYESS